MRRNRFRPGDDAVSPVVGVVLLVGIAVMLMTTVGVFVLGFGPGEQTPEAELQFHQDATMSDNSNVTITVVDPANMQENEISITVNGSQACPSPPDDWLEKGESVTIGGITGSCSNGVPPNSVVTVIWESSGGSSAIVGEYRTI